MRRLLTVLLVIALTSSYLPAVRAAEDTDHTLVIATPNADTANLRLEYTFLNRYPDGKIVYLEFHDYQDNALRLLADQLPDLIELSNGELTRYTNVSLIADLYKEAFPDGYPGALAPQARRFVELDGAMIGVPKSITVRRWKINRSCARKQGFEVPPSDWTIDDFLTQYFEPFNPDADGDGVQDMSFIETVMVGADMWNPIISQYAGDILDEAIIAHLNDVDYFLSDDFLKQMEVCKRISTSDKIQITADDEGRIIASGLLPQLFSIVAIDVGPYRAVGRTGFVTIPLEHAGDPGNPASVTFYSLTSGAPHHDLAVECLQMMASEAYQAIYDGTSYHGGGEQCFSAQEPSLQITADGGVGRRNDMVYSEEYHANVRIVDASVLDTYHITALTPSPEQYQAQLDFLDQAIATLYDNQTLLEIKGTVFWPALKGYFKDNMTAEEVARLMYQRLRIALYE
ncbi:MAG: hypothetical protein J1E43_01825 [Christensenellaceae bacterium]|nr:hypothetical protein [Christensenellaceae bacterium]